MGTMIHHTIIVTSWKEEILKEAHIFARRLFGQLCSEIVSGICNREDSFFIAPDGSKEGWSESNVMDAARVEYVKWLHEQAYDDGSNCLAWVELMFGGDLREPEINNHQYKPSANSGSQENDGAQDTENKGS